MSKIDARSAVHFLRMNTVFASSKRLDHQMQGWERLPAERLAQVTAAASARQARFAMENTEFYRDYYRDAGFTLKDLDDPAAFLELPIVEKSHVREHRELFISKEKTNRNSVESRTGGSTGEPLRILRDVRFPARVLEWQLLRWWGVPVYGNFLDVRRENTKISTSTRRHDLSWWPSRRFQHNTFYFDDQAMAELAEKWRRMSPDYVVGYVGGIYEAARRMEALGLHLPAPTAIATTAAPLTKAIRHEISRIFGAPVYDQYRCAEIPWMAGECSRQDGLHVFEPLRRIEIVDRQSHVLSHGETGETVVSDLGNRVFPLIRYRIGDLSRTVEGTCPCGVTTPRIASVAGRTSDELCLPSGAIVPTINLTNLCDDYIDDVSQFQIHQKADSSVELRLVMKRNSNVGEDIAQTLRNVLNGEVPVSLKIQDEIAHDGGKIRYMTSDISAPGR
ncbi:phenylacetate--CoA ligase family protein [Arthrobacter sp.]|uniref:phenylacetate--CoA ligase family protein n=1 Tax=Arthrobacter sp. TaxID=1667 RepID=UPI003A90A515